MSAYEWFCVWEREQKLREGMCVWDLIMGECVERMCVRRSEREWERFREWMVLRDSEWYVALGECEYNCMI